MTAWLAWGSWLWAAFGVVGAGAVLSTWFADRKAAGVRRALVVAAALTAAFLVFFVAAPEAAIRGWLPGATEPSLCDESPGSGCGACTAELEAAGLPTDPCHRRPFTAFAIATGGLGPLTRARALDAAARDQRWMLRELERRGSR